MTLNRAVQEQQPTHSTLITLLERLGALGMPPDIVQEVKVITRKLISEMTKLSAALGKAFGGHFAGVSFFIVPFQ